MKKLQLHDIIETERLIIKIPEVSEAQTMYDLIDDSVTRFMEWEKGENVANTEKNLRETIGEIENGEAWQAAVYLKNGELIGRCGMHTIDDKSKSICLGYWLADRYRGNGYIPECVEKIKQYCFEEMGVDKITIRCEKENIGSRTVAEKSLFVLDGIIRHDKFQKGKYVDNCYYSFLKQDYNK